MSDDVNFLRQLFRDSMELQAQEGVSKTDDREFNSLKPMQVLASILLPALKLLCLILLFILVFWIQTRT